MKTYIIFKRTIYTLLLTCFVSLGLAQNEEKEVHFEIITSHGTMKGKLYNETPGHRDNFVKLAGEQFYDSLLFHRVMNAFMIQGGDPASKNAEPGTQLGNGGPGYTLPAEILPQFFHKKGALAAARQPDNVNPEKRSSGSQYYVVQGKIFSLNELKKQEQRLSQGVLNAEMQRLIQSEEHKADMEALTRYQKAGQKDSIQLLVEKLTPIAQSNVTPFKFTQEQLDAYTTVGGYPPLDGNYTVFGEIYEGLDVIDKITANPVDRFNRPTKDIIMSIRIIE